MDYASIVEQAIKQFYAEGNNEAHSWLLQVQASREAWTFVWQLLEPSKSWEVQFFAATTLHTKISKQWNEVPKNEYPILRERMLASIRQPDTPKFVLLKLCQALVRFLANSAADDNEKEKSVVDELVEMLPYDSPPMLELLLRVLSILPVEIKQLGRLNEAGRLKFRGGVVKSWCQTTWLLQQVFTRFSPNSEGSDNALYLLAVECALSWLKLEQLPPETNSQLYPHLLAGAAHYAPSREGLDSDNTKGWEIVQECLILIVTNYELRKRPQTFWEWATSLIAMAWQYADKCFCKILTAIGEAHSRSFLIAVAVDDNEVHKWTSEGLIELLLECSEQEGRYPTDETRSCIPFGFWYALQDDLATLDEPLDSRARQALKPIYARLAQALLRKSTLPLTPNEGGDADERERFRCYRQDVADTLDYCYSVLGEDLLILLGQRLSQQLEGSVKWTDIESTLHALKALAESVGTNESHYIPALMDLVLSHIPYDLYPGEVLACSCSTIGAYSEWIGEHPDPWLERVLRIVTLGLTRGSVTAPVASLALKDLARECEPYLAPYAPSILNVIGETLPNVAPGGNIGLRLMYAAGKLLKTLPSMKEQLVHLEATLGLCIIKIRKLLDQPLYVARVAVTNQLKMASIFFSTLEGPIGKAVLEGFLPIFNQIVDHPEWSQDNATLEAMHTCVQRSLSSLSHPEVDARPILQILSTSYKKWPHPAALDLLKQLVLLFGKDQDDVIIPVFAELSSVTLSGVRACRSVHGDLSDWFDLMESYLGLLAQICRKNARMLLRIPEQIPEMLQCGIACLALPEKRAVKAAGHFLAQAIMQNSHLQTFVQPIGQELISAILQCLGGDIPRNNCEPYAEVLLALKKTYREWTAQWLRAALKEGKGFGTQSQRENFARMILQNRRNRNEMGADLMEFSIQCHQQTIGL